jgi:hypothetical protein
MTGIEHFETTHILKKPTSIGTGTLPPHLVMMALAELTTWPEQLFASAVQRKRVYSECGATVPTTDRAVDDRQPISKRRTKRTEKNVRFSNADIVTVFNAAPEEVSTTLWYQRKEYQRIRQETKETIAMFEKLGCPLDSMFNCEDETYCLRGLEGALGTIIFRMLSHRSHKIVKSVLCQQQMLRHNGRANDIEALRLSSTVISMFDKRKAWTRAQDNEKLVI